MHLREVTIEWGQCDPAGIVYYPRYFELFNRSTALLVETLLNLGEREMIRRYGIVGMPVTATEARFLLPSRFGDRVTIESRIAECRPSTFKVAHRLINGGEVAVEASETRVWAERDPRLPDRIRPAPLPPEILHALTPG